MRSPLAFLALIAVMLLAPLRADAMWNAEWTKRSKVTLNTSADGLQLNSAIDSVPVLVRLHTGNFGFLDAAPDGADLRFIAADDKTPLKFHVEKFDGLNELALVWVMVPRLEANTKDAHVWVYYGNPTATAASDPKGSYDPTHALVLHFGETQGTPQDATANNNHAASFTGKPSPAGIIGGAATFDGSAGLAVPASASLRASAGGLTVSMWIKPTALDDATLYRQAEGTGGLALSMRGGRLVAQAGTLQTSPAGELVVGTWAHVAVVVGDGVTLYLNGQELARAQGVVAPVTGAVNVGGGFKGEIDELQVASTARSADWLRVAAGSQGEGQRLASVGAAEGDAEGEGASYIKILLSAVTIDGWVVIALLGVMFVLSLWVMWSKVQFINRVAQANRQFLLKFDQMIAGIDPNAATTEARGAGTAANDPRGARGADTQQLFPQSQLYRLYVAGVNELHSRFDVYRRQGRPLQMSAASLSAIRATVDAALVREVQRLNSRMVVLTISIAGGPFLGLLGTVVGVMITFAAIAAAGDVNVNAIAPGIAAALVATVAGLIVAIPALFAYNYLTGRIGELASDMEVFVDELTTRIAENHSV